MILCPGQRTNEHHGGGDGQLARAWRYCRAARRAWSPPYDCGQHPGARPCRCPRQSWPFPGSCHPAAGAAADPGGAPAAQRGRTTWRRGKTTAAPDREDGQGPRIAAKQRELTANSLSGKRGAAHTSRIRGGHRSQGPAGQVQQSRRAIGIRTAAPRPGGGASRLDDVRLNRP